MSPRFVPHAAQRYQSLASLVPMALWHEGFTGIGVFQYLFEPIAPIFVVEALHTEDVVPWD